MTTRDEIRRYRNFSADPSELAEANRLRAGKRKNRKYSLDGPDTVSAVIVVDTKGSYRVGLQI